MTKYSQGKFVPRNPQKYVGDVTNIVYRSSWEKKLLIWLDTNPNVLKYSSEETIIPYISPVDHKQHRYFVDATVMYKTSSGEIKKALIEIKPRAQTKPPVKGKKQTKYYLNEVMTYSINTAKWAAAREWADKHGFEFKILDEYSLGLKK